MNFFCFYLNNSVTTSYIIYGKKVLFLILIAKKILYEILLFLETPEFIEQNSIQTTSLNKFHKDIYLRLTVSLSQILKSKILMTSVNNFLVEAHMFS